MFLLSAKVKRYPSTRPLWNKCRIVCKNRKKLRERYFGNISKTEDYFLPWNKMPFYNVSLIVWLKVNVQSTVSNHYKFSCILISLLLTLLEGGKCHGLPREHIPLKNARFCNLSKKKKTKKKHRKDRKKTSQKTARKHWIRRKIHRKKGGKLKKKKVRKVLRLIDFRRKNGTTVTVSDI